MRGGRCQRAQSRQTMLACQRQLGRGQARLHTCCFAGNTPGIDRGETDADHQRGPDTRLIKLRQIEMLARRPWQRAMSNRDQRHGDESEPRQDQRIAKIERCRGDDDGGEKHQREGIGDAAGQIQ